MTEKRHKTQAKKIMDIGDITPEELENISIEELEKMDREAELQYDIRQGCEDIW